MTPKTALQLSPVPSDADLVLRNYENLLAQRTEMNSALCNIDRQIVEARTQLKSALENHKTKAERVVRAKPPVPRMAKADGAPSMARKTSKVLGPLLKHFTVNTGEFTAVDVEKLLRISRSTAFFRIQRGVALGLFEKVGPGRYKRAAS